MEASPNAKQVHANVSIPASFLKLRSRRHCYSQLIATTKVRSRPVESGNCSGNGVPVNVSASRAHTKHCYEYDDKKTFVVPSNASIFTLYSFRFHYSTYSTNAYSQCILPLMHPHHRQWHSSVLQSLLHSRL